MSKDENNKNKERELLAEIKSLEKRNGDVIKLSKTRDQQLEKLKAIESKQMAEIEGLKVKMKEINIKEISRLKAASRTSSIDSNKEVPTEDSSESGRSQSVANIPKYFKSIQKSISVDSAYGPLSPSRRVDSAYGPLSPSRRVDSAYGPLSPSRHVDTAYGPLSPSKHVDTAYGLLSPSRRVDTAYGPLSPSRRKTLYGHKKGLSDEFEIPIECMIAYRSAKWIGINGGIVKMPLVNLIIQGHCLQSKTLVTATKIEVSKDIVSKIKETRLQGIVQPILHMYIEPQGIHLDGEVYLDIIGCVNNPRYRYVILHKQLDYYNNNQWQEITNECNPRFKKGSILRIPIPYFDNYIILRLDVPVTSFIGHNINLGYSMSAVNQSQSPRIYYGGINTDVIMSIVNGKIKKLEFLVYHDIRNKNLNIWAREVSRKMIRQSSVQNTKYEIPENTRHMFIKKLTSNFPLCCNDRIYFHFDGHKKWQQMGVIDFSEIASPKGQLFKVALSVKKGGPPGAPVIHLEKMPKKISISRRVADRLDSQEVCKLDMIEAPLSNEYQMASITTAVIDKVLARVRIRIMRTVDVKYIMEIMRKRDIFTPLERDEVIREKTPYTRAKLFMDYLARKGARGMVGLCDALETDYVGLSHEIRAILQANV